MDAYSVSCTSPSQRSTSKIYQDLKSMASRLHSLVDSESAQHRNIQVGIMNKTATQPEDHVRPHIGVVGAGLAGLRCADVLLRHGFRVTVIEGRDRLGGRVRQELLGSTTVDMGPNWIHGTDNNPINDIAQRTGTATSSPEDAENGVAVMDDNGNALDRHEAARLSGIMWEIVQAAFKLSNGNDGSEWRNISPSESLLDFFHEKVPKMIPESVQGFEVQRKIVLQMAQLWGAFVGSPVERQSLKFFWLEECIEGENLFCSGTYARILAAVAKPVVEGACVIYNATVTHIQTGANLTTSSVPKTILTTSAGHTLNFDEVVVTAPLGWLKQHPDAFTPPLPPRIRTAISSLGYGTLEKVYISFPDPFWRSTSSPATGFVQWLSPSYAPDTNPSRWTIEAVELASLDPPEVAHATLLFYLYGDISAHIQALTSTDAPRDKHERSVVDFFRPYFSRLPGYDIGSPSCKPCAVTWTSWSRDELAGNGSYTNFPVGLTAGDEDVCALREYVGPAEGKGGGLYLAGEHTAPFVALGTTSGAYWSGEVVAGKIAERYGMAKRKDNEGDEQGEGSSA